MSPCYASELYTARHEPKWETYRSFLAVMNEGSLSGAARKLALTQPTIGRHIDALEADLGLALFTRSQSGLLATQAARELLPHATAMASAADALVRASSGAGAEERGTVRLTASVMIGGEVLPPILTAFREKHPSVAIELVLSDVTADLARRDADIAVRMVRPKQDALVAKKIGRIGLGLHAHRRYLAAHGVPQTLDDLVHHSVIGFDKETAVVQTLRRLEHACSSARCSRCAPTPTWRRSPPCAPASASASASTASRGATPIWYRCCPTPSISRSRCGWRCTRTCAPRGACGCCSIT